MFVQLAKSQIEEILDASPEALDPSDRDELMIPSYVHPNPLIRWLVWRRLRVMYAMARLSGDIASLDFGCGIGLFLPTLAAGTKRVFAVDLRPQCAMQLSKTLGIEVTFLKDLRDGEDACADVIVTSDVLEHVEDLPACVEDLKRKLKRTGRLLVCGPTENALYKIGRWAAGFGDKGDYHHRNIHDIRKDIEKTGFRLVRAKAVPFVFPCLFKILLFELLDDGDVAAA